VVKVAALVAVVALPERAPVKVVAVRLAVVESYNSPPSVLAARLPVAESYTATKLVASVESTTVTVEARVAKSIVMELGTSASDMEAQVRFPLAAIVVAKVLAPQSDGLAARAVAVSAFPVSAPINVVAVRALVVALYVRPASVAGARDPVAEVPSATNVVVSPPASAKVTVPALPETDVWSPVLVPEMEEAPAPIVRTEVLATLPASVTVPVLTVRPVVRVALVTLPAVSPLAVPVKFVATPEEGVPSAPPE
jgi:hypothetical protein